MKFAEFDVEPDAGVLRRNGERVKLQDLPFRVLVTLLRRAGQVVSRETLRAELWGAETFVDAEAGLNTAIAKLREALGDHADAPRFIETVPKRGYRFIGTLVDSTSAATPSSGESARTSRAVGWRAAAVISAAALGAAYGGYQTWLHFNRVTIAVVRFHNETGVAANDRLAGTLTDAVVVSLAGNRRYAVIGNSPLLRTDRIFQDVPSIATALRADYVLLGQLQNGDTGLVARAHFIRASDQSHLWAGRIDLAGVPATEQAVTSAVADGVAAGLKRR